MSCHHGHCSPFSSTRACTHGPTWVDSTRACLQRPAHKGLAQVSFTAACHWACQRRPAPATGPASSGPALATGPACGGPPGSTPHVIETVWSVLAKEFPTIVCKLEGDGQSLFFTATVGSICAGMGNYNWAIVRLPWGFCHVFWCYSCPVARKFWKGNFGDVPNWSDCTSQEFLDNAPHCNILLAGFPCQPYSVAGKGQGKNDVRGRAAPLTGIIKYIEKHHPELVLLENVAGLFLRHRNVLSEFIVSPCLISIGGLSEYSQHHHTVDILAQQHHMSDSTRGWSWPPNKFTQRYSPGSISNLPRRFEALRRCCSAPPEMPKRPGGPRRMPPRLPPGIIAEFGGLPPQSVRSYLS